MPILESHYIKPLSDILPSRDLIKRRENNVHRRQTDAAVTKYYLVSMRSSLSSQIARSLLFKLAEREGFEPPVPVRAHSISSAAPSAARSPLRKKSPHFIAIRTAEDNPKIGKTKAGCGLRFAFSGM